MEVRIDGGEHAAASMRRNVSGGIVENKKSEFLELYIDGRNFEDAANDAGVSESTATMWLVDDPDFAFKFERAMEARHLRAMQRFIDASDEIAEKMIELAKTGKAGSVAAAKMILDEAKKAKSLKRRSSIEDEEGTAEIDSDLAYPDELDDIAKGIQG